MIALGVFMLGGQGRVFYANTDWQVRDAVLGDMAAHKWPFAYQLGSFKVILRAPLGMYLLPALAGKAHELALLLSNSVRLALLLSLGWQLFDSNAKRLLAVSAFLLFSGWDIIGTALMSGLGRHVSWDHLEPWSLGFQYSSNITLAFWAPNHALAGWTCALTFELWRRGKVPLGLFAAAVPLVAIWSPLALMGAMPFVMIAGMTGLLRRAITWRDITLACLALLVALPSLWFMTIDAAAVGSRLRSPGGPVYLAILAFEVLPFVLPPLFAKSANQTPDPVQRVTLWVVLVCLLFMPFGQIGIGSDFQMRSSIMPLALLALAYIGWIARLVEQTPLPRATLACAILTLAIGAVTPAFEIHRALTNLPAPEPQCSLIGVWSHQTDLVAPPATYLARASQLPGALQNMPITAGNHDPAHCWNRVWITPRPAF
ncbi:hypothetical protein [Novosphingobium sp.]|uniref:hypothetical protein n=1 Tax=Novosphingobium sp. TaxID=1874826 RepID=UPI003D13B2B2